MAEYSLCKHVYLFVVDIQQASEYCNSVMTYCVKQYD